MMAQLSVRGGLGQVGGLTTLEGNKRGTTCWAELVSRRRRRREGGCMAPTRRGPHSRETSVW